MMDYYPKIAMVIGLIVVIAALTIIVCGCGPSGRVPIVSGIKCCDILKCEARGWDVCRDDGEDHEYGVNYANCSCHNLASASTGCGSNSDCMIGQKCSMGSCWNDYSSRDDYDKYEKKGHGVCKPK